MIYTHTPLFLLLWIPPFCQWNKDNLYSKKSEVLPHYTVIERTPIQLNTFVKQTLIQPYFFPLMKGNSFKSIFYLLYIINVNTFFHILHSRTNRRHGYQQSARRILVDTDVLLINRCLTSNQYSVVITPVHTACGVMVIFHDGCSCFWPIPDLFQFVCPGVLGCLRASW